MYVDSSAVLKLYFDEPEREECIRLVRGNPDATTARVTQVEVRRTLARDLSGSALDEARLVFAHDWSGLRIVEVDEVVCERAAEIAESTGLRSLDAIHLGAADPLRGFVPLLTYDARQAEAARSLGWTVLGA